MKSAWLIPVCCLFAVPCCAEPADQTVTIERKDGGYDVSIGGRAFTTLQHRQADETQHLRPFLFPVLAADGTPVTSDQSLVAGGDHPHHRSIWVGHGDVNGGDHWSTRDGQPGAPRQIIPISNDSLTLESDRLEDLLEWESRPGETAMNETRSMRFGQLDNGDRYIDITSSFTSLDGDVRFGDTKEAGLIAIRAAAGIAASAWITASTGCSGEPGCWGKPAEWCDISGLIAGKPYGITVMSHPENQIHPTRWHVRAYGLLAANPLSLKAFEPGGAGKGHSLLEDGGTAIWRHRILVHRGDAVTADVRGAFLAWAGTPGPRLNDYYSELDTWNLPEPNPWWTKENGAIVGRQDPAGKGHILETEAKYRDVIVDLEYRYSGDVDSGVFLRAGQKWQCQIGISRSLKRDMTGSIYDAQRKYVAEAKTAPALNRIGEWNRLRIEARGDRFRHWLNGVLVLDYTDPAFTGEGPIGLQLHGGVKDMKIEFRNIRVLRLEPPAKSAGR